jgi:hypothetical protein
MEDMYRCNSETSSKDIQYIEIVTEMGIILKWILEEQDVK